MIHVKLPAFSGGCDPLPQQSRTADRLATTPICDGTKTAILRRSMMRRMTSKSAPGSESPVADLTVSDLIRRWPQTARVFLRHRMACVGCAVAPYMTVAEVATSYGLSAEAFVAELRASAAGAPEPDAR